MCGISSYSLEDSYNVHRSAQFNVAENIATTSDMPYNAEKLVNRMKLDPRYVNPLEYKTLPINIYYESYHLILPNECYFISPLNETVFLNSDNIVSNFN